MNFNTKLLLLILFLMKVSEISSTRIRIRNSPKKYDITKHLNKTIVKLFHSVKTMIVTHLLKKIQNEEPETYKYKLTHEIKDFKDKIIICDVTFYGVQLYRTAKHINYEFFNNKIQVGFEKAEINLGGDIEASKGELYGSFDADMIFRNECTITVTKSSENDLKKPFRIELECSDWNTTEYTIHNETVTRNQELVQEIKSRLPTILFSNMNNNQKLIQALNKSYGFQPKKHIIAKRRDFLGNEQQYYYRISKVSYFCFNLRNITIHGLTNFHSLKYNKFPKTSIHTLLIKDIRGNVTLDYEQESEPALELKFSMDWLSMSMDKFCERHGRGLKVGGHWSSVSRAKDNVQLTNVQAEGIIRAIESALASSLMPNLRIWEAHELATPIGQKCSEISPSSDWKSLKESYKKWVPFNEDDYSESESTSESESESKPESESESKSESEPESKPESESE